VVPVPAGVEDGVMSSGKAPLPSLPDGASGVGDVAPSSGADGKPSPGAGSLGVTPGPSKLGTDVPGSSSEAPQAPTNNATIETRAAMPMRRRPETCIIVDPSKPKTHLETIPHGV
jgi:hypothetical protein